MSGNARRGFFRIALDAMIAAREKQVERYLNTSASKLDDRTLKANGISAEQITGQRHFTSII